MTAKINIDIDEILNRVYAESARRAVGVDGATVVTDDQRRLVTLMAGEGFAELCSRLAGYLTHSSFNANGDERNVIMWLRLEHTAPDALAAPLHDDVVELLAHFALMRLYGDAGTYYGTAWRRHRAHVLLLLARDQAAMAAG